MMSALGQGLHRPQVSRSKASGRSRKGPVRCCASLETSSSVSRRAALGSLAAGGASLVLPEGVAARGAPIYPYEANMYGEAVSLEKYKGQVLVVVNVFGGQAPLSDEGERSFAYDKFGFEFDVFDKIEVNGEDAHPLYKYMRARLPKSLPRSGSPSVGEKGRIEWNYVKFLIDRNGIPVRRYSPGFNPRFFEADVKSLLAGETTLQSEDCLGRPKAPECIITS